MACYHPLQGWKSAKTSSRKGGLTFNRNEGISRMDAPCGKCDGCLEAKARDWSARLLHENSEHVLSTFFTLTYDNDHIPPAGNLRYSDVSYFLDRLRHRKGYEGFRYYYVGEYGDTTFRPHYHGILFGVDFPDKKILQDSGEFTLYESETLSSCWQNGFASLGTVTPSSCMYVSQYIQKHRDSYPIWLVKERSMMSRRPGIGYSYQSKWQDFLIRDDGFHIAGKPQRLPRFYDKKLASVDPEGIAANKLRRISQAQARIDLRDTYRLSRKEIIHRSRLAAKRRKKI